MPSPATSSGRTPDATVAARRAPVRSTARIASIVAALAAVVGTGAAGAGELPSARVDEPRAYGYTVGDVVARRIALDIPAGYALDRASLPQPGGRGKALELRRVALTGGGFGRGFGSTQELRLDYQVFLAPPEVRTLEMPAFTLRFEGGARGQTLRIDAWPLTVSPLVGADAPARRGLGELQPDADAPPVDTGALRTRLAAAGVVSLLAAAYLAWVYLGVPWRTRRQRPFGLAWAALERRPAGAGAAERDRRRDAYAGLHAALNRTAGEVLFAPGVDRFVAAQPRFAPLRMELHDFFRRSQREFFGGVAAPDAGDDLAWLRGFCRRCRDVERGAA